MSTEIKKHPLAVAWDGWIASDEGKRCSDGAGFLQASVADVYLENRLQRAFMAGAKVSEGVILAAQAWRHDITHNTDSNLVKAVDEYEKGSTP